MTATPPGSISIVKDLLNCRAHCLEERPPCKSLVEGSTAIDRGGHVNFAEAVVPVMGHCLIGVEINKMGYLGTHMKDHDGRTVGDAG